MYSTCIFCNKPLGRNEALEAFPVGQRIAFDAKRGRLWVVCRACERWNLSPFEERWEGVEQAERAYRDTRLRVATDNIGLAKLRDGTTLVCIGEPLRPEFAAWRYGDQFGRRRRRALLATAGGLAGVGVVAAGSVVAGVTALTTIGLAVQFAEQVVNGRFNSTIARIPSEQHGVMRVRRRDVWNSWFELDDGQELRLHLAFKKGEATFAGREAERIAGLVVPKVNRFGGNRTTVAKAVAELESVPVPEEYVRELAKLGAGLSGGWAMGKGPGWRARKASRFGEDGLKPHHLLALEMALHEESEHRAMEGELAELERAWRDAEEIAGIADSLAVPASVDEGLQRAKARLTDG